MLMRQVFPSSPSMSRGAESREPRREPPPGQSTWSRETLCALFPLSQLHVKWVFAYWEDQDPPGGESSTQPALHSTLRHTHPGPSVETFMIKHCLCHWPQQQLQVSFIKDCLKEEGRRLKMKKNNRKLLKSEAVWNHFKRSIYMLHSVTLEKLRRLRAQLQTYYFITFWPQWKSHRVTENRCTAW